MEHLLNRYGSLHRGGARADRGRDPSLAEPLPGADDYLRAEVVYAATHEGARHLEDVLTRRTRISIETFDRGGPRARDGGRADGRRAGLGRGADRAGGRRTTRSGCEAERESQPQPDDQTADAARLGAPDIAALR